MWIFQGRAVRCERERAGYVAVGTQSTCTRVCSCVSAQVAILQSCTHSRTLPFSVVLLVLLLWYLQHPGAGLVLVPVGGCVDCDCVCQRGWSGLSLYFFVPPFIGYTKGRFEAIKDIYSPYQIHLHQVRFPQLIASYKFFLTGPCLVLVAMIWL